MRKITSILRENPNGLLEYEIDADPIILFPLATMIQKEFGLKAGHFPAFNLDCILVELIYEDLSIIVGWDIWSDIFIAAQNKKANDIIKHIADYVNSKLDELEKLEEKLLAEQKLKEKN